MKISLIAVASVTALALMACGGSGAGSSDEGDTEDELRTAGIKSIEVHSSAGFRPPPPPGSCWESGSWAVDYGTKQLTGNACLTGRRRTIDRTLSAEELTRVKRAVSGIRIVATPAACPTDVPVRSMDVKTGSSETHYVEERGACNGGKAVRSAGLEAVITVLQELSEAPSEEGDLEVLSGDTVLSPSGDPGDRLNDKLFEMEAGTSLSFDTSENQIRCIRDLSASPARLVTISEKVLTEREQNLLGGTTSKRHTLKVVASAESGKVIEISSGACFQSRNDPGWNLKFKIRVK